MRKLIQATSWRLPFPDNFFHSIITSPPYYSLRVYEGKQIVVWPAGKYLPMTGVDVYIEIPAITCAFGHEPTIEAYIFHSLLILRECYRVLRPDGVLWWNIGDCYSAESTHKQNESNYKAGNMDARYQQGRDIRNDRTDKIGQGQLIGIPYRLMLAAQADGWIVRNDVVWSKISAMPESLHGWQWRHVTCSCVKEQREKVISASMEREGTPRHRTFGVKGGNTADAWANPDCPKCQGSGYLDEQHFVRGSWRHTRSHETILMMAKEVPYWSDGETVKEYNEDQDTYRNPRSVVSPRPSQFPGKHFAVYPSDLIRPFLRSTVPTRCCKICGTGWSPEVIVKSIPRYMLPPDHPEYHPRPTNSEFNEIKGHARSYRFSEIKDYHPSCDCGTLEWIPGRVLDPFCGSGTTLAVAEDEGMDGYGVDVSFKYLDEIARNRTIKNPKSPKKSKKPDDEILLF